MLVDFQNVLLPNFLLGNTSVPFLFQEKCNSNNIINLLSEYIDNIDNKKKIFKKYSEIIQNNMDYGQSKKIDFSNNSSKEIINIINNYNY